MNDNNQNKIYFDKIARDVLDSRTYENNKDHLFEIVSMISILNDANVMFDVNLIQEEMLTDGGGDIGIDCMAVFLNDTPINEVENLKDIAYVKSGQVIKIFILQSKFSSKWETAVWEKLLVHLPDFFNPDLELKHVNEKIKEKHELISVIWNNIKFDADVQVNIVYSTLGNANHIENDKNFRSVKNKLESNLLQNRTIKAVNTFEIGLDFIMENSYKKPTEKELITTALIRDSFNNEMNDGYVALVNIKDYFNFLITDNNQMDYELFSDNVRDWQNKTSVNENIKESIVKDKFIDFWWLNNGVTMIVTNVVDVNNKLTLQNPKIVNGLQSSYSIFETLKNNEFDPKGEDKRKILLKIIRLNDENGEDANKVIAATNTQNPMNWATLSANNKILKELEIKLKANGLFLERRKGYYKNRNEQKAKIILPDFIAKYYVSSVNESPSIAKNRTIIYFRERENFDKIFNEDNVEKLISITILANKIVSNLEGLEINNRYFALDKIKSIKMHFKYHIISIYYKKNGADDEFDCEKLKFVLSELLIWLEKYITKSGNDNIRKLSTSIEFQKYMYHCFENESS
jgi:hypothetical protein